MSIVNLQKAKFRVVRLLHYIKEKKRLINDGKVFVSIFSWFKLLSLMKSSWYLTVDEYAGLQ